MTGARSTAGRRRPTTTAWTPLGWGRSAGDPFPSGLTISTDGTTDLVPGAEYCVRVQAIDRRSDGKPDDGRYGDWSYLPANGEPAFKWNGPPASAACTAPCRLSGTDYGAPLTGSTVGYMPLFTWSPIPGAESYYVLVARDPNFTNVIDYAYTRLPAYAPRLVNSSLGYADETTLYYWAVLPADNANGSGVSAEPLTSGPQSFTKQSTPPTLLGPISAAVVDTPSTVFQWQPVFGARHYRIQVSSTPTFSGTLLTERRHRLDRLHEQQDVPGRHGALLARARGGRGRADGRRGADLVEHRHVQQAAPRSGPRRRPTRRTAPSCRPCAGRRCRARSPTTSASSSRTAT